MMVELKVSVEAAERIASGTCSPVIRALLHDNRALRAEVERQEVEYAIGDADYWRGMFLAVLDDMKRWVDNNHNAAKGGI